MYMGNENEREREKKTVYKVRFVHVNNYEKSSRKARKIPLKKGIAGVKERERVGERTRGREKDSCQLILSTLMIAQAV